ncbi:uncharacterized protein TNCV_4629161 [Trichonephila clavipes]|nr:uncharacterized protein TNCV_4629161 [Trichonephila clavipes]
MSLPNPVEQKSHDVINNKLSRVMKEVAEESMKMAAVEEYSSSPDNLLTVSGDGTWKTRGHSSLIGVCTVTGAETGKVLKREVLSSFCNGCDSYKGVKFGIKYNKNGKERIRFHVEKIILALLEMATQKFNALSENKPYGDDYLIQKIECVGHVQKRMGRLTDSLIDKLAHYYGNAIRCNSTSVKEMRKAIWAVWGHSCSTDDEPIHWFCPTNPNTWCKYNAAINNNLQNYKHKPSVAKAVQDVIKPVFADLSHPALLKKCLGEKFGLKINRNVCVSLAERDNRRIFTSRQRCLQSSFEARRAKKVKKSKEIELFQEQEVAQQSMRARNYCAHHNTPDHWTLRCMNRCPDLVVCLKRDLQCLRPEASLVLIYRPNVAGMKGRVDLAQPVNRTPDLWCGNTIHYHSTLFDGNGHQSKVNRQLSKEWKIPPSHHWYAAREPGSFLDLNCDRASKTAISDWLVDTRKVFPSLRAGRLLSSAQVQGSAGLCRTYPGLSGSFQRRLVRFSPSCYRFFEGQQFNGSCLTSSDN